MSRYSSGPPGTGGMPPPVSSAGGPPRGRDVSLGFNELNMTPDGSVMTKAQIIDERIKRGLCETCIDHPTRCFEVTMNRFMIRTNKPRTEDGLVYKGTCLRCHPSLGPPRTGGGGGRGRDRTRGNRARDSLDSVNGEPPAYINADCAPAPAPARARPTGGGVATPATARRESGDAAPRGGDDPRSPQRFGLIGASVMRMPGGRRVPMRNSMERQGGISRFNRRSLSVEDGEDDDAAAAADDGGETARGPPVGQVSRSDGNLTQRDLALRGSLRASVRPGSDPSGLSSSLVGRGRVDEAEMDEATGNLKEMVDDILAWESEAGEVMAAQQVALATLERPDSVPLASYGIKVMSALARKGPHAKDAIMSRLETGGSGLGAIVVAMEVAQDPQSQDLGCRALWSLAVVPSSRAAVARAGGSNALISALGRFCAGARDNVALGVVHSALGGMKPISADPVGRESLEALDAASVVVEAMRSFRRDDKTQSDGCTVMANLVVDSSTNRVSLAGMGEVEAILGAMAAHPGNEKVQKQACFALHNYAFSDVNLDTLREHEPTLTERLEEASRRFQEKCEAEVAFVLGRLRGGMGDNYAAPFSGEDGGGGQDGDLGLDFTEQDACSFLTNAVNDPSTPTSQKINTVTALMMDCMEWRGLLVAGLDAFVSFCQDGDREICDQMTSACGLAAVMTSMSVWSADTAIQEKGSRVLEGVACSSPGNRAFLIESGGCQALLGVAEGHPGSERVQVAALRALQVLVGSGKALPSDEIRRVVKGLVSGSASRVVQRQGSEILRKMARENENGHLNWSSGGALGDDPAAQQSTSVCLAAS